MKQLHFEQLHEKEWEALESQLAKGNFKSKTFPNRYRQVCKDLATAKARRYSPALILRLNNIVLLSHNAFYKHNVRYRQQFWMFFVEGFPQALRNNRNIVLFSSLLFFLPLFIMATVCYFNEEAIFSVMSYHSVIEMENNYNPESKEMFNQRESDSDLAMFGFYIKNNIGISFRTFASGIFFGLGSLFFLIYNGIVIGASAGHLVQVGYSETFFSFVAGHSSFELMAIVFSGAAGIRLGMSIIDPGSQSRIRSLSLASKEVVQIMYGAMLMLFIAAFLEAFWSSSMNIPFYIKATVGIFFWLLVIVYCFIFRREYGFK